MTVVADTSVLLDFFDGKIQDPWSLIYPFRIIRISPVALHEVLRAYPSELQGPLFQQLDEELLPIPSLRHWVECAKILQVLYSRRKELNIARMQNDILIALMAKDIKAPIWSRDSDFERITNHLGLDLIHT